MGDLPSHQGYNGELFLSAEMRDHSTISYSAAMIGGCYEIQPHGEDGLQLHE